MFFRTTTRPSFSNLDGDDSVRKGFHWVLQGQTRPFEPRGVGASDHLEQPCGYDQSRTTGNRVDIPEARPADVIQCNPLSRPSRQLRGLDPFIADWTAYNHLSETQLSSQEGLGQPPS